MSELLILSVRLSLLVQLLLHPNSPVQHPHYYWRSTDPPVKLNLSLILTHEPDPKIHDSFTHLSTNSQPTGWKPFCYEDKLSSLHNHTTTVFSTYYTLSYYTAFSVSTRNQYKGQWYDASRCQVTKYKYLLLLYLSRFFNIGTFFSFFYSLHLIFVLSTDYFFNTCLLLSTNSDIIKRRREVETSNRASHWRKN